MVDLARLSARDAYDQGGDLAATFGVISAWLDELYANDEYTHMIAVCDTFDWEDYPVYVKKTEDVKLSEANHNCNMQTVMEIYSKNYDKETQLKEHRAFHYD